MTILHLLAALILSCSLPLSASIAVRQLADHGENAARSVAIIACTGALYVANLMALGSHLIIAAMALIAVVSIGCMAAVAADQLDEQPAAA